MNRDIKIKVIDGESEQLFTSEKTQIAVLEIPEHLVTDDDVIQRARRLIKETGSVAMQVSFEKALSKRTLSNRRE